MEAHHVLNAKLLEAKQFGGRNFANISLLSVGVL